MGGFFYAPTLSDARTSAMIARRDGPVPAGMAAAAQLAVARSVAPSRDADIGLVRLAGRIRPVSPVKPAVGHAKKVPTDAASR